MEQNKTQNLDKGLFFSSIIFTAVIVAFATAFPENANSISGAMFTWVTRQAGWFIEITSLGILFFMGWLAFGKIGKIKLGDEDSKPQFRFSTYAFMMFTAGVGSSLIYWAMGEPMTYLKNPPMFAEPYSMEATLWAITYPIYHWGPIAWAIYCLPAIPFGYFLYNRKQTNLRLSNLCAEVIGEKNANGWAGYVINVLGVFGTMCAVATGMGFCCDLIASGLEHIFGIPNTFIVQILIVGAFVVFFTFVVLAGLKKGIAKLSDWCVYIAILLALYVLMVTDTGFAINYFVDSLGLMFNNFIRISLWTDPVQQSGFPQDWTVYYWAWYFAFLIMMGLFISKISKGRTIKQVILTGVICGSLGCAFFTGIFGSYAVGSQMSGALPIADWISQLGRSPAIIKLIAALPFGNLMLFVFLIVQFFLLATTLTSSTYSLSMMSSKNLPLDVEPDNRVKIIWAFAVGGMSIVTMLMGGGITAIKSMCVVAGFPLIFVLGILCVSLIKWVKNDMSNSKTLEDGTIIIQYDVNNKNSKSEEVI